TAVHASGKDEDLKETRLAAANLQSELSSLDSEEIKAKANEKMFVVQDRHVDLTNSFQLTIGGGKTVNPNIYLDSDETTMSLRYYFNNMFFAQVDGSKVNTDLTT